jgi:hypothetical protein
VGCRDVEVENRDGALEHRSMVYTEYFARGTEPATYCELHPTRTIFTQVAGFFTGQEKPVPPHAEDPAVVAVAGLPPPMATATGGSLSTPIENLPPPPRKKRGFFSRMFGIGKDHEAGDTGRASVQSPKKKTGG